MLGPAKPRRLDAPIAVALEALVPADNFYRHLEATLDPGFVRDWTRELYAVEVAELKEGPAALHVCRRSDRHRDVDDRLGGQAGHRGAARAQAVPFLGEGRRPLVVGWYDAHRPPFETDHPRLLRRNQAARLTTYLVQRSPTVGATGAR
jgi:hypothetical protein